LPSRIHPASHLPGIGLLTIKLSVKREFLAKSPDTRDCVLAASVARDAERPVGRDMDLNLVALFRRSASTTEAGSRMARLLPHFETRMTCLR
jgi:hypothetical protein